MKQLVHAFIISRHDHSNGILDGLPISLLGQLQQAENAAARLVFGLKSHDYVKPAMFELRWLPVNLRIQYKLCLLMHSAVTQCVPVYISDIVQTTAASDRQRLRSSADMFTYAVLWTDTKLGDSLFSIAGHLTVILPSYIRRIPETNSFKCHLKTYF